MPGDSRVVDQFPDAPAGADQLVDGGLDTNQPCDPAMAGTGIPVLGPVPSFHAVIGEPRPVLRQLTQQGLTHYPDLSVSLRQVPGGWQTYLSALSSTYRLTGSKLATLTLSPTTPVLTKSGVITDPHHGYAGASTVIACGGQLVMFYHAENHHLPAQALSRYSCAGTPYLATMNRAISKDNGQSFVPLLPSTFLSSSTSSVYIAPKCAYGAGGGSLVAIGDFLYLYYFDWNDPQSGLHVARSCRSDCGAVGSWRKYFNGSFASEASSGALDKPAGPSKVLIPAAGSDFDSFVTVSRNSYLNAYLMVSATRDGFRIRVSADGINWGAYLMLLKHLDQRRTLYPTVFDASTYSRDVTGRRLLLIYARETADNGLQASHRAFAADIELCKAGDSPSGVVKGELALARYRRSSAPVDHWTTTGVAPGYTLEDVHGYIAANSIPGTLPLHSCLVGGKDHMLSTNSTCEGAEMLQIVGYIYADSSNRTALYRCRYLTGEGHVDHFTSTDPACEGKTIDGVLGYME
jgi:hypothetical protein